MAFVLSPVASSTIAFGSVTVGSNSSSLVSIVATVPDGDNNGVWIKNTPTITGPQAAQFSFNGSSGPHFGYQTTFTFSGEGDCSIKFSPSGPGAATATFTAGTFVGRFDSLPSLWTGPTNFTYTLTGTGVSGGGGPTGEAPVLLQNFRELLVPSTGTSGIVLSYYNSAVFNDANDSSTYVFKSEDIIADRVPTVRRVIITYVDLGVATLNVTVSAVNDSGVAVIQQGTVIIGTVGASGLLATAYADITVTGYRPQVSLLRAAGGGPVAISHVMVTGTIEKEVTL